MPALEQVPEPGQLLALLVDPSLDAHQQLLFGSDRLSPPARG
jgi:hypothetical protein